MVFFCDLIVAFNEVDSVPALFASLWLIVRKTREKTILVFDFVQISFLTELRLRTNIILCKQLMISIHRSKNCKQPCVTWRVLSDASCCCLHRSQIVVVHIPVVGKFVRDNCRNFMFWRWICTVFQTNFMSFWKPELALLHANHELDRHDLIFLTRSEVLVSQNSTVKTMSVSCKWVCVCLADLVVVVFHAWLKCVIFNNDN